MKKKNLIAILVGMVVIFGSLAIVLSIKNTQASEISPWEQNDGEGLVYFGFTAPCYGWEGEYDFAIVPVPDDPGWKPAPDPQAINYEFIPSSLCDVAECRTAGQFTYFRTFVEIPQNFVLEEFRITSGTVDDGVKVVIFNSNYPDGITPPDGYVFLGGGLSTDIRPYAAIGETNTIILIQVDDCCYHSYLYNVNVIIRGRPAVLEIPVDIKPQSCPNPLNVNAKGVLPVAILGITDFDVSQIDLASIKLEGVSPLRSAFEDVATPFAPFVGKKEVNGCTTAGADGYSDLTLKFDNQQIVSALGAVTDKEVRVLKLTGNLLDSTPIVGEDVVIILKKK